MGLRYLGNINKPGYNPLASNITTGVNVVQYQGIFTTQQQLQAITTGQWVTDPVFDYSTLLLQADGIANGSQNNTFLDSSTNNFTITRNGNTTQGTFSPFSLQPGAWANFFDGSSAQLSIANSTNLDLGSGNWTIEAWLFPTAFSGNARFFSKQVGSGNGYAFRLQPTSGYIYAEIDTVNFLTSTVSPALNTWSHVAIVRNSNTVTIYLNGVSIASASYSSTPSSQNAPTTISGYDIGGVKSEYFPGYISNLRFVKGTAVYTSSFTPSTTPLTAVTNTQLLTCQSNRFVDNSTNAFSITLNGAPSVQAFSPFAPQFQYTASVTGGSGYFDGTGDYLQSSGDFFSGQGTARTFQCWIYVVSMPGAGSSQGIFSGANSGGNLSFRFASDGTLNLDNTGTANIAASSAGAIKAGQWTHVAVTRTTGNLYTLYVNGSSVGSGTNSTSMGSSTYIGSLTTGSTLNGYMAGVRVTNTVETISVPTAPLTAISGTALLLNFTNAGILDGTMKNNLETVGNASVSTSVVKYGSGSLSFDGTGDYLKFPSGVVCLPRGSEDFTVEMWLYKNNAWSTGNQYLLSVSDSSGFELFVTAAAGALRIARSAVVSIIDLPYAGLPVQTWFHFAATRQGNIFRMFVNGILSVSATNTGSFSSTATSQAVGAYAGDGSAAWNGYIDDLRITKGIARYTQNFTPPSVALPRQ